MVLFHTMAPSIRPLIHLPIHRGAINCKGK
ncbi:MAG: hypothetical protein ACI945_000349 [Pseudohongiellaceae bacterium]